MLRGTVSPANDRQMSWLCDRKFSNGFLSAKRLFASASLNPMRSWPWRRICKINPQSGQLRAVCWFIAKTVVILVTPDMSRRIHVVFSRVSPSAYRVEDPSTCWEQLALAGSISLSGTILSYFASPGIELIAANSASRDRRTAGVPFANSPKLRHFGFLVDVSSLQATSEIRVVRNINVLFSVLTSN
jgi:hypothetical protein